MERKYWRKPPTAGRPVGSRNRLPRVQYRAEIDKVYKLLGGVDGLWKWAHENPKEFYPLILKVMATYELKDAEALAEPIKVLIMQVDGSTREVSKPIRTVSEQLEGGGGCRQAGTAIEDSDG